MDSVFRSAREKLEKEHIERKGSGKLKLQQEKKANVAAERQRQAIEASQRARRLKAIEAKMQVEDKEDVKDRGGDYSMQVLPPWMDRQGIKMEHEANVDDGGSDEDSKQGVAEEDDDIVWDKEEDPSAGLF
ncbi:uncharacterized protein LOC108826547 [Raphanus sativus]|uniref:Uncharacterized protein LOC108826547 n=1 Tax=Raphanus sativus TaxID=3726 RepID=A0A9W3CMA1_RAPSA|nr:uncharacterized protein LOC108826547 [Raphanus sativus]